MTPEQILQADMILDPADLRTVVDLASRSSAILEIWLDRDKRTFTSRFYAPPEGVKPPEDCLWIFPLEPANGNILVRQTGQIKFMFYLGQYAVGGSSQFLRVETVGNVRVLAISIPSLLRSRLQRSTPRYPIPRDRPCIVRASRLREIMLSGTLLDVHLHGLGFEVTRVEGEFEKGDSVSVEVQPSSFGIQPFKVLGTVCFKSRIRDNDSMASLADRYGILLAQDSQYILLRQLVEKLRRMG
ncbi:MAG: hypothetical protein G8345_13245 [Magnetococcales bacterium]|nr:hypothetical protein [Magnetococcales bacterium]NGZ27839.1 hypothetical protein [Magnetococcales bacterium]